MIVLRIDEVGDEPGLGARQFVGGHPVLGQLGDDAVEGLLELGKAGAGPRRGIDAEPRRIERHALVPGAGIRGETLVDHQRPVEPAGGSCAQDLGEHIERRGVGACGRERGYQITAIEARLGHPGIRQCDLPHRNRLGLLRAQARTELGPARELAVSLLCQRPDRFGADVPGDHDHRIVGRIEAPIESERVLARERLDLVAPADHRPAVGMVEIERRLDLLGELRGRIVGDALIMLLQHHVALGQHVGVGQHQAGHAIGFECHDGLEVLARDPLVERGIVVGRERILLAADFVEGLREFAGRDLGRALEHQVLEEMREPRLAGRLVGGSDPIPDHVGDDRRAVVGDDDEFEPVVQGEIGNRGELGGLATAGGRQRRGRGEHGPEDPSFRHASSPR